jgi:hypothetical protein
MLPSSSRLECVVEEFAELRRQDKKKVSPRPEEGANEDELGRGKWGNSLENSLYKGPHSVFCHMEEFAP